MPSKLTKKQLGKRLVIGGLLFIAFVLFFLSRNIIRAPSFAELLPAQSTAALFEFPSDATEEIQTYFQDTVGLNWKMLTPWIGDRAAVAILQNEDTQTTTPLLIFRIQSIERAYEFAKSFRNPIGKIDKIQIKNITAFSTPALHFVFLSDNLLIAPTAKDLLKVLENQSVFEKHLSGEADFKKIQQSISGEYQLYIKPDLISESAFSPFLNSFLTKGAYLTTTYRVVGVGASTEDNSTWRGSSYATHKTLLPEFEKKPYRAELLKFIPQNPDFLITGQDLARQIEQIEALQSGNSEKATLKKLLQNYSNNYLGNLDLITVGAHLFTEDFAYSIEENKKLFIAQIPTDSKDVIKNFRGAFTGEAAQRTTTQREVTLPDGTLAYEKIANPEGVKSTSTEFNDVQIYGIEYGTNERWYDATFKNIWIIGDNLISVEKTIARIKSSESEFQSGDAYKNFLQPILKNPDFIGFGKDDKYTLGISKRTFFDHMESNFMVEFTGVKSLTEDDLP